ncbi:MAG TPA: hypothetical protein VF337_04560 [Candidatus Limnocylindrales bacterium]
MGTICARYNRLRLECIRSLEAGLAIAGLVAGCSVAGASPLSPTAASPSTAATAASPEASVPTPALSAATFTTPGVASNWNVYSVSKTVPDSKVCQAP